MAESLHPIIQAADIESLRPMVASYVRDARRGKMSSTARQLFVRQLLLNPQFAESLKVAEVVDLLFDTVASEEEWMELFGAAVEKEIPRLLVDIVDGLLDVSHVEVLRLAPGDPPKLLVAALEALGSYLEGVEDKSARMLRGMRVARIQVDIYARLADPKIWRRRKIPASPIDDSIITGLKENKDAAALPEAYGARINLLQRLDLRHCLAAAVSASGPTSPGDGVRMKTADFDKAFLVRAPLRLGISSANASDNHLRSKEQGGKTLNVGIDLGSVTDAPSPPLSVSVRRLAEPRLVLRSMSSDFEAEFEADRRGEAGSQSDLFFAYRRGGDESLRMVKQALVHTGIVADNSADVVADVTDFTGGGGLEITTTSRVQQGSGLGTSSILAAAVLKVLYRLTGHPAGGSDGEYPALYDQSVLLEQSIGLNSGWQDARGACGGPSAIKDFYAPPTAALPAPELTFVKVDEELFRRRIILFDTGISRGATRGLNTVLDAYLCRDPARYGAIRESLAIHQEIVNAVTDGDYPTLGQLASRYWQLRCILDPEATSDAIRQIFEAPGLAELSEGGMLTGAGGGGFALLVSREDADVELKKRLGQLKERKPYGRSAVVDYRLNRRGLHLEERPV
jgi:galactokinase/mevalonate kinase-like predicted kinase